MDIRKKIGLRIKEAREQAGLTVKQLSELSDLKPTRIGNWEQGLRLIQIEEALLLAKILKVSPIFLLTLDTAEISQSTNQNLDQLLKAFVPKVIPVLDLAAVQNKKLIQSLGDKSRLELFTDYDHIPIDKSLARKISPQAFALKIQDNSMHPQFVKQDLIILDPQKKPSSGQCVLAKTKFTDDAIFRMYYDRTETAKKPWIELQALNTKRYPSYHIHSKQDGEIIATLVEHRHQM